MIKTEGSAYNKEKEEEEEEELNEKFRLSSDLIKSYNSSGSLPCVVIEKMFFFQIFLNIIFLSHWGLSLVRCVQASSELVHIL